MKSNTSTYLWGYGLEYVYEPKSPVGDVGKHKYNAL